ncbi:MAG: aldose epimerase [Symploca sp. SIO2E6]|nr:aldose epimerase [Symploca sp. SIO2E6]
MKLSPPTFGEVGECVAILVQKEKEVDLAIARSSEQYETYTLTDEAAQSQVVVVPERGGIVTSWSYQNKEIFYLDKERFKEPNLSVRGGIPILFPICGNLPDNTYTYKGQQYTLKQHGFARVLPWSVTEQGTDGLPSLTVVLNSNDETRAVYPFDFQVAFTYLLQGDILDIQQRYTNHSPEPMPFSAGFHPYFLAKDKTQLQFDIPGSEYQDRNGLMHPFSGTFDLEQEEIDVAFRQLQGFSASFTDTESKLQVTLSYSDIYSTMVFWAIKGKDFHCLEPWSAPRNALNTGEQLTQIPPGETVEALFRLTVKNL